ncbi:MAG: VOC family protein [Proteobacteria bacterium]|nr:VOC family protein [Pseudomonadota bacterium]
MYDRLDHVAIQVEDIAKAVAWYTEKFRVKVTYQDATWALLTFENASLALVVADQHPPHISVLREDAASFGPLKPHRDGTASIYLSDPDGNQVEVLKR